MHRAPLLLALGVALLAHLAPARAAAADVYGTWRSSSGNLFEITDSRRGGFKLRLTYPNGTQEVLRGDWVPGMAGSQFNYWNAGNVQHVATFSRRDPDRVRVVVGGQVSWWQRVSHAVAVPVHKAKVFGFWRSTSGNVFEITEAKRGGFKLWATYPSGKRLVLRGDWVRGMSGSQFNYWDGKHQYTGTFSPEDPDRVQVVAPGVVSWWQREAGGAAPVVLAPPPPPPPPRLHCWQRGDPGCHRTKGGYPPMDRDAFNSFYTLVSSARPHVFPMLDRVRTGVASGYLTSRQLVHVLQLFKPHVFPMLDVVKACAPRLVDPENGAGLVADAFRPHTHVGSQAAAVVAAQRGDGVAVAPAPVVYAPAPVAAPAGNCWDLTDPGCARLRAGVPATNGLGFATVLAIVRSAGGNFPKRLERARSAVSLIQLTSKQLATLIGELQPQHALMLELVRTCAPKVVDPENHATVALMFGTNRHAAREAARLLRAYPNP